MSNEGAFPGGGLKKAPMYKAPKAPRAKKPKKPCTYGPRLSNGLCPKKPRTTRALATGMIKNITRAAGAPKGGPVEKISGAVGAALAVSTASALRRKVISSTAVGGAAAKLASIGPRAVLVLRVGSIAAAGLIAYYLTKAVLDARRAKKMSLQQQAAAAADAYRDARLAAVAMNGGKPISGRDQQALGNAFKAQLAELGLTSDTIGDIF